MAVTTDQVSALRTYLTLDPGAVERSQQSILAAGRTDGFGVLVYSALLTAARHRFRSGWTRADIVRYVADLRTRSPENLEIPPVAAEATLRRALGDNVVLVTDETAKARTQVLLLTELIADSDLDAVSLEAFVAEARQVADQVMFATWLKTRRRS